MVVGSMVCYCMWVLDRNVIHGQKRYLQVLLDPARAALLDGLAKGMGVRTTALMRDWIYERLQQTYSPAAYRRAYEEDMKTRNDSISRQVEGRRKRKGSQVGE